jgi:murein DD-endopeptidase MepM/ murein hydrolase activator NlpD
LMASTGQSVSCLPLREEAAAEEEEATIHRRGLNRAVCLALSRCAPIPTRVAVVSAFLAACGDPHVLSGYRSPMGMGGLRNRPHAGVDFRAEVGDPVIAVAPGIVADVYFSPRAGYDILVRHPEHGVYTRYVHLQDSVTSTGSIVTRGQTLGHVGIFPLSGGRPHVHLELCFSDCGRPHTDGHLDGTRDPMRYIVGCYQPGRWYSSASLVLAYPIRC